MTNEWKEFKAYTEPVSYTATGKRDTSYLGRMTFETITEYVGMARILTILARGYLFHNADGSLRDGDPYARVEYARNALCAWCSVPDKEKESDPAVDFGFLSKDFPELVNENGEGWYWRHVKNVIRFVRKHPELTSVNAQKACDKISRNFTREWQKQVRKYQVPIFALNTKGAWTLRFDDILADAFEAVIASIYLDGGLEPARKFILRFIIPAIEKHQVTFKDYKTVLQEVIQKNPEETLTYVLVGESGPDHDKKFEVEVHLNSNVIGRGEGRTKKHAEQEAAREALELMGL